MNILAISGSSSASSSNTALLRALREVAAPNDEIAVFDGLDDLTEVFRAASLSNEGDTESSWPTRSSSC